MPTRIGDDSSDWSDDDERSEIETSVLLGIPDGTITKESDMDDAAVSRIGGHPVRPVVCLSCVYSIVLIKDCVISPLPLCTFCHPSRL